MLSQQELVQNLKERLRIVSQQTQAGAVSTGSRALDRLLGGGWQPGTLVEFFSAGGSGGMGSGGTGSRGGSGASSLALVAARAVCGAASSSPLSNPPSGKNSPSSSSTNHRSTSNRPAGQNQTHKNQPTKKQTPSGRYGPESVSTPAGAPASEAECPESRALVVVDERRRFYPPAAAAWQVDLERLFVVCPASAREHHWALHQALSCAAVGAVLCWPERLDARMFRRLQLAAETSGGLGLLVRPATARGKPSWAQMQLSVESVVERGGASVASGQEGSPGAGRRRLRIELLRSRGSSGSSIELEIDERGTLYETNTLPLVSELAPAATWPRSAGA